MSMRLCDAHCHLGDVTSPVEVAADAYAQGMEIVSVTTTPVEYIRTHELLAPSPNVHVGIGLHPWRYADGRCDDADVARFEELSRGTRILGEIGIDRSPRFERSIPAQVWAFERAVSCARGDSILSIHAVRSAGIVLDVLARHEGSSNSSRVFHWFSGTSEELHAAVVAGCWFSVGERMLRTRQGREYAREIPEDRLLVETDAPWGDVRDITYPQLVGSLERTLGLIARLRGRDVREQVRLNSERLLSR